MVASTGGDAGSVLISYQNEKPAREEQPDSRPLSEHSQSSRNESPEDSNPTTNRPARSNTLAARRQVQRLPGTLETLFPPPTPSDMKATASAKRTAESENRARWEEEARTPTPTSAQFGGMLETLVEPREEVERVVEMMEKILESKVRNVGGGREWEERVEVERERAWVGPEIGSEGKVPSESGRWGMLTELRVKQRLFPAMLLLSRPSVVLMSKDLESAAEYAHSALRLAQNRGVDEALQARCAYYAGLAELILAVKKDGIDSLFSEEMLDDLDSWGEKAGWPGLLARARDAKGVYREGEWTELWIGQFQSLRTAKQGSPNGREGPTSAGSWVGSLLRSVWSGTRENGQNIGPGVRKGVARRDDGKQQATRRMKSSASRSSSPDKERTWERIPSFSSTGSDEDSSPTSSKTTTLSSPPSTTFSPIQEPDQIDTLSLSQSLTADAIFSEPTNEPTLPPPVTSPQTSSVKPPLKSVSPSRAGSGFQEGKRHSRKSSLLARVTGRERRLSELEQAEEGHSPFRATFEGVPEVRESEGGGGLKKRKGSGGETGDLV